MTYKFQSQARTHDLPMARFEDYQFATDDPGIAEGVRRNCQANPHQLWEVTPEKLAEGITPEPKKLKMVRGKRTSDVMEREK